MNEEDEVTTPPGSPEEAIARYEEELDPTPQDTKWD